MTMLRGIRVLAAVLLTVMTTVQGDEMAFVDVMANEKINIRQLDNTIDTKVGYLTFLQSNPMISHDWIFTTVLKKTVNAEIAGASRKNSAVAERVRKIEGSLASFYAVLPKNSHGRLGANVTRYALHRHFTSTRGWTLKGLQPAGSAWQHDLTVGSDVRQVSKWIGMSLLVRMFHEKSNGAGIDLHMLAVMVSTIEHLVRAETQDFLYTAARTLQIKIDGEKDSRQVDEILMAFLMIYAFGLNLEITDKKGVQTALDYLKQYHPGWNRIQALAKTLRRDVRSASFPQLVDMAQEIANKYSEWHGQDCPKAKDKLKALGSDGLVPLERLQSRDETTAGRPLFGESAKYLTKLGATSESGQSVVIPNYMYSAATCLGTASFFSVCCPNQCERMLEALELSIGAVPLSIDRLGTVTSTLQAFGLDHKHHASLSDLLASGDQASLYSQKFAHWLHTAFPLDCPLPSADASDAASENPKTAAEWMSPPRNSQMDSEDLITQSDYYTSRFTAMGGKRDMENQESDVSDGASDVLHLFEAKAHPKGSQANRSFGMRLFDAAFKLALAASMLGLVSIMPSKLVEKTKKSKDGAKSPGKGSPLGTASMVNLNLL